jgi:hypothetical protein
MNRVAVTLVALAAASSGAFCGTVLSDKECEELVRLTRECRNRADHYERSQLSSDARRFRECEKLYFEYHTNFCASNREFIQMMIKGAEDNRKLYGSVAPNRDFRESEPSANPPSSSGGSNFNASEVTGIIGDLLSIGVGVAAGAAAIQSSPSYSGGGRPAPLPNVPRGRESGVSGQSR